VLGTAVSLWKLISKERDFKLKKFALKVLSMFGNTYV